MGGSLNEREKVIVTAAQAMHKRDRWYSTVVMVLLVAVLAWGVWGFAQLTDVPENQGAAEGQLERPLLFYDVWDGTPYVVFASGGMIHFDRLILDRGSISWPPSPRWQWSGKWESLNVSNEPASAGFARVDGELVVFGQINDLSIARIEVLNDFGAAGYEWHGEEVEGPGYAVRQGTLVHDPVWINWLDAAGHVVYSISLLR